MICLYVLLYTVHHVYCMSFDQCLHESTSIYADADNGNRIFAIKYENKYKEDVSFDGAIKKCRLCFDANLTTTSWDDNMTSHYPTWIGVYRLAKSTEWKWINGSTVENWKNHVDVFHQDNLSTNVSYGIISGKWNNKTFWLPIPMDQSLYNNEFRNTVLLYHQNNDVVENLTAVLCERPYRSNCHYWNVSDSYCSQAKRYGCHKHILTMMHEGDGRKNVTRCRKPDIRRFAVQCPDNHCFCNVTEWSEWSDCSAQTCSDGLGERHRVRNYLESYCPQDHTKFPLKDTETCTVYGCDKLGDNRFEQKLVKYKSI